MDESEWQADATYILYFWTNDVRSMTLPIPESVSKDIISINK